MVGPGSPPPPIVTDAPAGCRSARAERPVGRWQMDRWRALPGQDRHVCRPPCPWFSRHDLGKPLVAPSPAGAPVSASAALVSLHTPEIPATFDSSRLRV